MISLTCAIYKIQQTSDRYKKEADSQRKQNNGYQWEEQYRGRGVRGTSY